MSVWKGEIRLKVCFERLSMLRDMAISLSFKRRLSTIKCAVYEHPCSDCLHHAQNLALKANALDDMDLPIKLVRIAISRGRACARNCKS